MRKKFLFCVSIIAVCIFLASVLVACDTNSQTAGAPNEKHTVTFYVNGAEYYTLSTAGNEIISLPDNPASASGEFAGWFVDNNLWQNQFTSLFFANSRLSGDMKVYAKFVPSVNDSNENNADSAKKTYLVVMDSKGDTPIRIEYVDENGKIQEPVDPTRTGYKFVAWKNSANDKVWNFDTATVTTNIVLYAEWREVEQEPEIPSYLVIFDSKGNESIRFEYVEEGSKLAEPSEPSKDGYTFLCWKNAADDSEWNFEEDVIEANTVLYAEWREVEQEPEIPSYLVIFDSKGNEPIRFEYVEEGSKLAEPSEPSKDGYTFLCWKNAADDSEWNFEEDVIEANTVLYAAWREVEQEPEIPSYLVIFDSKGNEPICFEYVEDGSKLAEPSEPSKDGYTFLCWKNAADDSEWNFEEDVIETNTVLYAVWQEIEQEPKDYLVIFDSKNGEPTQYLSVKEGEKIAIPEAPERYGYNLVGWKNLAGDREWNFETDTVSSVTFLYADWEEKTKYLVTFDNSYGETYEQVYVYEGEKVTVPDNFEVGLDIFNGWQNVETGETWNFDEAVYSDVVIRAMLEKVFLKPCNGTVTRGYDLSLVMNPSMGQFETHPAIDFVSDDLEVYAAADGVIKTIGHNTLYGNYIVIEHSNGYVTKYLSLDTVDGLTEGESVTRGQVIGMMSDSQGTEASQGAHLHFEVTKDGESIDPTTLICLE